MENSNQAADKQKTVVAPIATQALQVMTGAPPPPVVTGSTPAALPQASLSPRIMGPTANPHRRSTSSNTSTGGTVARITWSHPTDQVLEEEGEEEAPVPVLPAGRRRDIPRPEPPEVPPQWLARLDHLQKGLQDVKYQIEGAPEDERQGVPFTDTVMVDELPLNCHTPAIAEYDGTTDPMEHLSRFENAALLHCYTDGIKYRVFVTTFARAAQQWKLRKTKLSLFAVRQKDDEPLKEYLQRFNAVALEVPAATQEVKASAFSQGLLDGDFFKSLAKKPVAKFDALLARAAKPEVLALTKRRTGTKPPAPNGPPGKEPNKPQGARERMTTSPARESYEEDPQAETPTRHESHKFERLTKFL
ncbi:UNVERIFIED_CONTAM: hypothetical protein Slati_2398600 [Sesamum latifolium]|uniref:Retrotransposon gag domain-containing protein n=1 Tax=Sesamum latifolium TaxID=2727402 RepID=A0AAW2WEH1_9LAMI